MANTPKTNVEDIKDDELDTDSSEIIEEILDPKVISRAELQKVTEDRKYPKVPGKKPSTDEAVIWFKNLEPSVYNRLMIYVYRAYPVINKRMLDPKADVYIDKLNQDAFDEGLENYLTRVHGGGKYKIIVNDVEVPQVKGTNSSTLMTFYTNISFDKEMPKLDYKELDLNARENAGYIVNLKNIGVLNTKGELVSNQQNTNTDTGSVAESMGKMFMSLYKEMNANQQAQLNAVLKGNENKKEDSNGISNLLLENLKQNDPNKQVTTMLSVAKEMRGEGGSSIKELVPLLTLLLAEKKNDGPDVIAIMSKAHEQQMALMSKLIEAKSTQSNSGDNFLDSLVKFSKVKETMPELFGNPSQQEHKKQTAELIIDGIKEIGLPAIGLISQFFQMRTGIAPILPTNPQQAEEMVRQAGVDGQGRQMSQSPQQIAPPNNSSNPSNVRPINGHPSPPMDAIDPAIDPNTIYEVGTQTVLTDPAKLTVCQKFIMQYGGLLATAIKTPKMNGVMLADNLIAMATMLGFDAYGQLQIEGQDNILAAMKSIPAFWQQTGMILGDVKINKMIDEFMRYEELIEKNGFTQYMDQDENENIENSHDNDKKGEGV